MMETGLTYTSTVVVSKENVAATMGSGDLNVFATPAMVALMENAAMSAVADELPEGSTMVGFHGESVGELRTAFEEAVEDYLTTCEKLNRAPQKPYSGRLMLRVPPEIHAAVAMAAQASGKSINQWAAEAFARAVHT